jgi:hypothetical protein
MAGANKTNTAQASWGIIQYCWGYLKYSRHGGLPEKGFQQVPNVVCGLPDRIRYVAAEVFPHRRSTSADF